MSNQTLSYKQCDFEGDTRDSRAHEIKTCAFCTGEYCPYHIGTVDLSVQHVDDQNLSIEACSSCLEKIDNVAINTLISDQLSAT